MLIKEVCESCKLTKKAIEYYEKQGLVKPKILPNGYRDYDERDVAILKEISVLRKLDISIPDIQNILNNTDKTAALSKCMYLLDLKIEKEKVQRSYMKHLINDYDIEGVFDSLQESTDKFFTIREKLVQAFPGAYGIYLSIHFGQFLNGKIDDSKKEDAYRKIIDFLDGVNSLNFSSELEEYLESVFTMMEKADIEKMNTTLINAISDVDNYMDNNKEIIEEYLKFRTSTEYKETLAYKIQKLLLDFQESSGYYDVFLTNLKIISPSYQEYIKRFEKANQAFIKKYPNSENLYKHD
ncbi:MAG: MerR family transcriptional regulator [Firmicutes bacterium]|nr:MerR family transcriptional regulator [Bacillota bacterium]